MIVLFLFGSIGFLVVGFTLVYFGVAHVICRHFSLGTIWLFVGLFILTLECLAAVGMYEEDRAVIQPKLDAWEARHGL